MKRQWHACKLGSRLRGNDVFRRDNKQTLDTVYPYYKDRETFVSMAKQAREELEAMMSRDRKAFDEEAGSDWD
jgi:glutathione-regulated potassium-efflux system ancillary protein KefC